MKRKKRGFIWLLLGALIIALAIFIAFMLREEQKKAFDKLYNSEMYLKVDYGIIPQEEKLRETNALFKKVKQDNYYYLFITKDNILFTYYLKWYYSFDPLKGYNIVYKMQLNEDTVQNILKDIAEKEVKSLNAKIESEYIVIRHDDENAYIKKKDLQLIFQNYEIILDI